MKRFNSKHLVVFVCLTYFALLFSCQKKSPQQEVGNPSGAPEKVDHDMPDPANEDQNMDIPDSQLLNFTHDHFIQKHQKTSLKWHEKTHDQYVYWCAKKLGLSEERAQAMGEAAEMPDFFQAGIQNGFAQQWSHAYMYSSKGNWEWGDADDDFHDNLLGSETPGKEGEGYKGKYAGLYYDQGDQKMGDWYVGYGLHYITDVSETLHSTFIFPKVSMAFHHFDFESWVLNNWTEGHCFVNAVKDVDPSEFYQVSDLRASLKQAAYNANYYSSSFSGKAWDAYGDSGYPKGVGEGNAEAVKYTKVMIHEAAKWTGGSMKFILQHYNQLN
ncbi:MAG: hypothetical protein ACEPOW_05700 [Bacteroidales bacterium]